MEAPILSDPEKSEGSQDSVKRAAAASVAAALLAGFLLLDRADVVRPAAVTNEEELAAIHSATFGGHGLRKSLGKSYSSRGVSLHWSSFRPDFRTVAIHPGNRIGLHSNHMRSPVRVQAQSRVVTPIGPFCPFRSASTAIGGALDEAMVDFTAEKLPDLAGQMGRLQLEVQSGGKPDLTKVAEMADSLERMQDRFEMMIGRMQISTDFQTREYYKAILAWTMRQGQSFDAMQTLMKWQVESLRCLSRGQAPPELPKGIDMSKLQAGAQQDNVAVRMLGSPMPQVDVLPFVQDSPAFQSEVVQEEYKQLGIDHASIIKLGEQYGTFDPLGKIAFLDQVEAIEERWDIFFSRFALMDALNPKFEEQTSSALNAMGMDVQIFRENLAEAHALMRKDAEDERDA
eukprot:gnl/TRDRNA2_/TRDRNA2_159943_c0_seq2.p1 gnl/TRDRNA2_/TRDRNA2_159943_c0~~gnl/TRDRNA2_/TRDRNA2_159943_c0_seq2.p1  ORF type:complete len:400 (+),score=71.61 gnl/TRDRNA2_/TRDRNA2_159943_c0_seq2:44-1243(+)